MILRPTDDLRIERTEAADSPRHPHGAVRDHGDGVDDDRGRPRGHQPRAARRGRPAPGRGGAVLDPRRGGGAGLRHAPPGRRGAVGGRPPPGDARLLREAADHRRLEGAHQRPEARRELRDQRRAGPGAQPPPRPREDGAPGRVRVPRHHHAPVHRRPGVVGGDRGPHDREPGPPRARLGALDAGRIQERHGRQRADRRRRDPRGDAPPPVPLRDEAGAGGHRRDPGERRLPRDPSRWAPPAELPRRGHRADRQGA